MLTLIEPAITYLGLNNIFGFKKFEAKIGHLDVALHGSESPLLAKPEKRV